MAPVENGCRRCQSRIDRRTVSVSGSSGSYIPFTPIGSWSRRVAVVSPVPAGQLGALGAGPFGQPRWRALVVGREGADARCDVPRVRPEAVDHPG